MAKGKSMDEVCCPLSLKELKRTFENRVEVFFFVNLKRL